MKKLTLVLVASVLAFSVGAFVSGDSPNASASPASLRAIAQCRNGVDDDGDTFIDFPADPGCTHQNDKTESPNPPLPACSDGVDNDGDTLIDFPNDPGCVSTTDNDETNTGGVPPPGTGWTFCAVEWETCVFTGTKEVAYGKSPNWFYRTLTDGTPCTNAVFGDPAPGILKECWYRSVQSGGDLLTWSPPALTNPIDVTLQNTGQLCPSQPGQNTGQPWVCYLDNTKDYRLHLNHRQVASGSIAGVVVAGGRNVVLIGGRISIPLPPNSAPEYREALVFHTQTGVVHIEGVLIDGWPLYCIVYNSAQAIFQTQNVRCEGVSLYRDNFNTAHSDSFIVWKSPPELRFDKFTSDYDTTGLAIYPQNNGGTWTWPGEVTLKRVNIRNQTKSMCANWGGVPHGHLFVRSWRQTRIVVDQMFAETGFGLATWSDCPAPGPVHFDLKEGWATYNGPCECGYNESLNVVGDGISPGSYIEFTNPSFDNIWGVSGNLARVTYGVPASGDFVPVGVAGSGYVSPGYLP